MRRLATAVSLTALLAVAAGSLSAQAEVSIRTRLIWSKGVGELRIGDSLAKLQKERLVGGARRGCELSPGERVAPLKEPPLKGVATFFPGSRLSSVAVTAGAETAAGIGIGDTVAESRRAYPKAPYDPPPPRAPIQVGFIWIGGRAHPKMTLVIDPDTHRVSEIAVPLPEICE